jgi:hypothetical protein
MGGKTGMAAGLALLLIAGMSWAGEESGGGGRGPSPITTSQQPDYLLKACEETEPTPEFPSSALRVVDPAYMLKNSLLREQGEVELADIKTNLLQNTSHGKITSITGYLGRSLYRYDPTPGFFGNDRAIFMAEYGGKHYKIILDIKVLEDLDEKSPVCPESKLIKVH